jgi:DnaA family protein
MRSRRPRPEPSEVKQLVLELTPQPEPCFGNFVRGRNTEALTVLERLAHGEGSDRCVFLWGAAGGGRSHLLRAVVAAARARGRRATFLAAPADADAISALDDDHVVALDDVQRLAPAAQRALFNLYNRLLAATGALVASADVAPALLDAPADLATRLAWGLVFEVHALDDAEKADAMRSHARARGFDLPPEVVDYLLRHAPRNLHSLLAMVEAIDRISMEQQRPVTLPLAREVLRSQTSGSQ